jgi:outer membrane usher protein
VRGFHSEELLSANLKKVGYFLLAFLLDKFVVFKSSWAIDRSPIAQPEKPSKSFSTSSVQRIIVPFLINGEEKGQVLVFLSGNNTITFQASPILQQTAEILIDEIQQKLQVAVDSQGNLTLEAFTKNSLEATFDSRKLELQIRIPPEKLRKKTVILGGEGVPPEAANALPPSNFTGWLNIRAIGTLNWSQNNTSPLGSESINLNLESAFNYRGWVLENSITFLSNDSNPWQRDFTSLVRDDLQNWMRYTVGDFSVSGRGFRVGGEFFGIAAAKNFSLQPYQRTVPTGEYEFVLDNPATVEIFVNDNLTQVIKLPAGRHDLRNLNLNTGINNVRLVITDDLGRKEIINFSVPFDFDLLASGVEEFTYALGFLADRSNGGRSYDFDRPTLSIFYRTGTTNNLTLGGYFQGDPQEQLIGVEGIWATNLGNFGLETAFSHSDEVGSDCAFRLGYRYRGRSEREFDFSLQYQGENFTIPGEFDTSDDFAYEISAIYRQKLFDDVGVNLGINYRFGGREEDVNSADISLGLSKSLARGLQANLLLQQQLNVDGQDDFGIGLNLSWTPVSGRQYVRASTNTISKINQLSWFSNSPYLINGTNAAIAWQNEPTRDDLNATLEYTHYRGKIGISQNIGRDRSEDRLEAASQLRVETAIVFADGYFSITRPVRNSFVLVVPHPNLKGQTIELNPFKGGNDARIDSFGAGVIPDLQSYRVAKISIDAPDLPLGYDLGSSSYYLLPTYKSGTLIKIGSDATVFIRGILTDAQNNPISLKAIEAISLNDPDWQPVTFFTNRAGKFAAEGFKPGSYEGRILGENNWLFRFTIPQDRQGIYDLGTLLLSTP